MAHQEKCIGQPKKFEGSRLIGASLVNPRTPSLPSLYAQIWHQIEWRIDLFRRARPPQSRCVRFPENKVLGRSDHGRFGVNVDVFQKSGLIDR
jgi:hypothetical protein